VVPIPRIPPKNFLSGLQIGIIVLVNLAADLLNLIFILISDLYTLNNIFILLLNQLRIGPLQIYALITMTTLSGS